MAYLRTLIPVFLILMITAGGGGAASLHAGFVTPPASVRPLVRWWWFGPKTQDAEIVREIRAMKAAGFGGFELQTVYPLSLTGNASFLSAENLHAIHLAGETAHAEGLRVDLTLGSGWPFGGPHIPAALASSTVYIKEIHAHVGTMPFPPLGPGVKVVAVFAGKNAAAAHPLHTSGGQVIVPQADDAAELYFILSVPTGQQVKRAAVGAEGPVLDHMSAAAVHRHLSQVGETLLGAFANHPPYAVFSDSLECFGSDWTDTLLTEFLKRRGYDLRPHLLSLFAEGAESPAIRHDWALTISELTEDHFLVPVTAWAHARHTRFRAQIYGTPPVRLSANVRVDFADGEGHDWRGFSDVRWASSANHASGRAVTAAESWTWLHHGAFQATPLDVKAEADRLMLEGGNQFIAHGWPYSPPDAAEPGWSFYAAAALNDHNPWWGVMGDVNAYLQRLSFLLRQGKPVTDVAVYLPEDDALAALRPCHQGEVYCHVSVSEQVQHRIPVALQAQILDTGYSFDYTDDGLIATYGLPYRVLILPDVRRMPAETLRKLIAFVKAGGTILATGKTPVQAPGYLDQQFRTETIRMLVKQLFAMKTARIIQPVDVGATLGTVISPDVSGLTPQLGFVHRKLAGGDVYFLANTGNTAVSVRPVFRAGAGDGQWWEPRSGAAHPWSGGVVRLAPYQSRVFIFGDIAGPSPQRFPDSVVPEKKPLNCRWSIAFGKAPPQPLKGFVSWTDIPGRTHFSGVARYICELHLAQQTLNHGAIMLDFGPGTAKTPEVSHDPGFQALLSPPLREAAEVFVNGKRAGAVWAPPYRLSLKAYLRPGKNRLEIRVGNTAINTLSGRPPADYHALNARFGERFTPQNMTNLQPLPSGILREPVLDIEP